MKASQELARRFCQCLQSALFMVIINRYSPELFQGLIFTFGQEKNLEITEIV
jgi:hypothetical protein